MSIEVAPRPLSPRERAALERILSVDFPGSAEFRQQLDSARVVAMWGEGSASVDLEVSDAAPVAIGISGVIPVDATVVDEAGELFGEIILWASKGRLSAIEYAWYGDRPPKSLPEPERISVEQQGA